MRTDDETASRAGSDSAALARQYGLTIYDAAYLEIAMRRGASLATTDNALAKAAKAAGVPIFGLRPREVILKSAPVGKSVDKPYKNSSLAR